MKLTKGKKIILTVIITTFIILLFNGSIINAEVNKEYLGTDAVGSAFLDEAVSESILVELLTRLIFAVGRLIEWFTSVIFQLITGSSNFPWADKIVFNAVPILDINFINPGTYDIASQTFVGQQPVKELIQRIYSTILALSLSFFGIAVMITSIKLVLSTIASEKAKYKQACIDWAIGLVTLFCMHYFISFIFYLNEQMVIVASKMVLAEYDSANTVAQAQLDEKTEKYFQRVGDQIYNGPGKNKGRKIVDILKENIYVFQTLISIEPKGNTGLQTLISKSVGVDLGVIDFLDATSYPRMHWNTAMIVSWATDPDTISAYDMDYIAKNRIFVLDWDEFLMPNIQDVQGVTVGDMDKIFGIYEDEIWELFTDLGGFSETLGDDLASIDTSDRSNEETEATIGEGTRFWCSNGSSYIGGEGVIVAEDDIYLHTLLDECVKIRSIGEASVPMGENPNRLITDLAMYFKLNSEEKDFTDEHRGGLTSNGTIIIPNMIMYTVLVIQSLILFIAYVKRLFYVLLLALMAPVVVVFDFFKKFGK